MKDCETCKFDVAAVDCSHQMNNGKLWFWHYVRECGRCPYWEARDE